MKAFCLLIIIGISLTTSIAQDQEYVINLKSDTIYGKVIISTYQGALQHVIIKKGKQKTTLKVYQTKSVFTKKGIYHPLKIKGQYQFALLEKAGHLSLYKYSGDPDLISLSFVTPILLKKSGEYLEVPNIRFKKQLVKFLSECETVMIKIETKEYGRSNIEEIINEYNQCISDNTSKRNSELKKAERNINKADQITQIKEAVSNSSKIDNKSEVIEMLNDVQERFQNGREVPKYLIGALKEKLSQESKLSQDLLKLIQ